MSQELIPDLPDELVCVHILPRIPWHARPAAASVSKAWKQELEAVDVELTREYEASKVRGVILNTVTGKVLIEDEEDPSAWRSLPPLPPDEEQEVAKTPVRKTYMAATGARVIVWRLGSRTAFVLDLCKKKLQWEARVDTVVSRWKPLAVLRGWIYTMVKRMWQAYDVETGAVSELAEPPSSEDLCWCIQPCELDKLLEKLHPEDSRKLAALEDPQIRHCSGITYVMGRIRNHSVVWRAQQCSSKRLEFHIVYASPDEAQLSLISS